MRYYYPPLVFTQYNPFSLSSANGPPYTSVLGIIAFKSRSSWSSPKLTSMQEPGAMIAMPLRACLAVRKPTPCAAATAALPSKWPSTATNPKLLHTCAAWVQRSELFFMSLLASRYCAVNFRPLRPSEWRAFAVARARRCARPCCARTRRLVERQVWGV